MEPLMIGIVEDDLMTAEDISSTLQQIGYRHTEPMRTYADALQMIETQSPDLLLIDIQLEGNLDGIDLAAAVNKDFGIPFIFLTANSDQATVNRAKEVKPNAYLLKPFSENDLYSSIEIAFSNYRKQDKTNGKQIDSTSYTNDSVFIKEGDVFHKVKINDILYIQSEHVYLTVCTTQKDFVIRKKLDEFLSEFLKGIFFRVHRSYAINLKHLETINSLTAIVAGKEIPLHKIYKQELLKMINSIK